MNKKRKFHSRKAKKDRTRNDKGILLEKIVAALHESEGIKVERNVKLPSKSDLSRQREIDVLLTKSVAGYTVQIAIQCKNYKKPVTIGQIGEFRDLLDDIGIPHQHGIIVSVNGYQSGAPKRATELGIKTLILEGLDKSRLREEIQNAFQFFVNLMCVVEEISIVTQIIDPNYLLMFVDDNKNVCGLVSDLIVNRWRNGEIPKFLGEYSFDLKLPEGWHQLLGDNLVYPESISAKVRVIGYISKIKGKFEQFKLKEAVTNKVEKLHLNVNFDVLNNLIEIHQEEPIFTEKELDTLKRTSKVSLVNKTRLPKIFFQTHFEPFSEKSFDVYLERTKGLSLDEIAKLPIISVEEFEGNSATPMFEKAAMGEPVFITDQKGNFVDVRLLAKTGKFAQIVDLLPLLRKYPRKDFAEYLSVALLHQGEKILQNSFSQESTIKTVLENEAFRMFDKSIELQPNDIDNKITIGVVLGQNKFYERAINCFSEVIVDEPQNELAQYYLAQTFFNKGDIEESAKILQKVIKENQKPHTKITLLATKINFLNKSYEMAALGLHFAYENDRDEVINNEFWHQLILDIYHNYSAFNIAIIVVDMDLYYVQKYISSGSKKELKNHWNYALDTLELIKKSIVSKNDSYLNNSFKLLINKSEKLLNEGNSISSTRLWEKRIESLKKSL